MRIMPDSSHTLLIVISIIGFLLRLAPITWGLPITKEIFCPDLSVACYHADENDGVKPAIEFPSNYFSSDRFLGYGSVLPYLAGSTVLPFKSQFDSEYSYGVTVWFVARLYSVLFGAGTIILTYILALRLFRKPVVANLSAVFIAFVPEHILASASAKPSVAMSFFLLLNFIVLFRVVKNRSLRAYIFFGVLTGIMFGTLITSALFLPIMVVYVVANRIPFKYVFTYLITCLAIFVLLHPYVVLDMNTYVSYVLGEKHLWLDRVAGSLPVLIYRWTELTNRALGFPITFIVPFSILHFRMKNVSAFLPLAFVVEYYILWRWAITRGYIGIISPILCMYGSLVLADLFDKNKQTFRIAGGLVTVGCIVSAFILSLLSVSIRWNDPRTEAAKFIHNTVPKGSEIGFSEVSTSYGWIEHKWRYPRINMSDYTETSFLENPEYLIISSFDSNEVVPWLDSPYLSQDYIWDTQNTKMWYAYIPPTPEVFRFYKSMAYGPHGYEVLKKFEIRISRKILTDPYPDIYIYKRRT